jgi:hypothetical protein
MSNGLDTEDKQVAAVAGEGCNQDEYELLPVQLRREAFPELCYAVCENSAPQLEAAVIGKV